MSLTLAFPFLLNQAATYWAPGGPDGFGGVLALAPILIKCRWQNVQMLFFSADAQEHRSNAVIYPDRELLELGMIALGDHTGEADPGNLPGVAWMIRGVNWSPSVVGDAQMNKVFV